jgi:hypothetical protein
MRSIVLFSLVLLFAACTGSQKNNLEDNKETQNSGKFYGLKEINADAAISADSLIAILNEDKNLNEFEIEPGVKVKGIRTKIEGKIIDMCKMSGCWFNFKTKDDKIITINMRDHKETPKTWSGKIVAAEGIAYAETISIEELRHNAKAEGASRDDLSKIKSPQVNYYLLADGAIEKIK